MVASRKTDAFTADEVCTSLDDECSDESASEMDVEVRFVCGSICN